jgi:hypothetical protein
MPYYQFVASKNEGAARRITKKKLKCSPNSDDRGVSKKESIKKEVLGAQGFIGTRKLITNE